jgi:chromosomal replication initiation ATPase DnaA
MDMQGLHPRAWGAVVTTKRVEGLRHIAEAVARHYGLTYEHFQLAKQRESVEARRTAALLMVRLDPMATQREIGQVIGIRWPRNLVAEARRDIVAQIEADALMRELRA